MVRARAKSVFVDNKEKERIEDELGLKTKNTGPVLDENEKDLYGEMFDKVLEILPKSDNSRYMTRLKKIPWEKVDMEDLHPDTIRDKVTEYLKGIRSYKNLREMLLDAKNMLLDKKTKHPTNAFKIFQREYSKKCKEENPDYGFSELSKAVAKKYKEMKSPERDRYAQEAKRINEENKSTKTLVENKRIHADPLDPQTPTDFYITEQRLKGSEKTVSELKSAFTDLSMKTKAKFILKALYLAKRGKKPAVSKEEMKILDEYEGRPKYPPTAFAVFMKENASGQSIQETSKLWKELSAEEKRQRKELLTTQMREYKAKMQKFLEGLSEERLELEKILRTKRGAKKDDESGDEKPTKADDEKAKKKIKKEPEKLKIKFPALPVKEEKPSPPVSPTKSKKRKLSLEVSEREVMPPPQFPVKKRKKQKLKSPPPPMVEIPYTSVPKKSRQDESTSSDDDNFESQSKIPRTKKTQLKKKKTSSDDDSEEDSSHLNGDEQKPKKPRKKALKPPKKKKSPPVQPVNTVYAYFEKYVYKGEKHEIDKAWKDVSKKQKKEYFLKISELNSQYMSELEEYLKSLSAKV
ncbi:hypothetical protein DMENIID0001_036840 [Sergentomyia squamirostris]